MTGSKLLPLAIFSLLLLTKPVNAQTSTESGSDTRPDYGIDLGASYPGTTVQALLEASEAEAGSAIDEAYAEGYKAGLLEAAPEKDFWKSQAESWKDEANKKGASIFLTGVSAGAAAAAITSLLIFIATR
jgi:hypothetical protein